MNDDFNKTFSKSFLLIKTKAIEKAHVLRGVMCFCGARTSEFHLFSFYTYYFHTCVTFDRHENRTRIRIYTRILLSKKQVLKLLQKRNSLSWWEGREDDWNTLGIFKSQKEIFRFLPVCKDPFSLFEGKTTNFRVFSYIRLLNKIIVIFHPILRNFQDISFDCMKWTLSRFVAEKVFFLWGQTYNIRQILYD